MHALRNDASRCLLDRNLRGSFPLSHFPFPAIKVVRITQVRAAPLVPAFGQPFLRRT